jgi:hypothetical protein
MSPRLSALALLALFTAACAAATAPTPRQQPQCQPRSTRPMAERSAGWGTLGTSARLFRIAHICWGAANLAALGYLWLSAAKRRRDRLLAASGALLLAEGAALIVGRGNCPFGGFQRTLGDPVPMFELVLPPRAAKAAIPLLTLISLAGFAALISRPPGIDRKGAH